MKQKTNDQQHILDALAIQDYMYVWQQVKYVGYKKVSDINVRYSIFCDVVDTFDYTRNNNFIQFYLTRLSYYCADTNETYYVSSNRAIIHKLRNENISPSDCKSSKITRILKHWGN